MAIGLINQAAYAHYGRYASTGYPRPSFPGAGVGDGAEYAFGCGIIIVTRPFSVVTAVMPFGEPFGLAG